MDANSVLFRFFCFLVSLYENKKDAAKSADIERGKYAEQQRQLDMKKRELLEKESKLQAQQSELELRINEAKDQKVHYISFQRIFGPIFRSIFRKAIP